MFELDVVEDDSLARFLPRWYGPPDRPTASELAALAATRPAAPRSPHAVPAAPRALPPHANALAEPLPAPARPLPEPLDEWYRLADRWSLPICRDHVFRPAEDLDRTADLVDFWHTDDGSERYAYDAAGYVFERDIPTSIPLRRFLVYIAVFEAVYAPIHGLVHLDVAPDVLAEITGRLLPLADPLWQWPDPALRYYADDDLLVHAGTNADGGRLVVAARHRDALGRFDGYDLDWLWDSRA